MHPTRLLPLTARLVDPGETPDPTTFVVGAGAGTTLADAIPCRAIVRGEEATIRDENNRALVDHDLLLAPRAADGTEVGPLLALGLVVELSDGLTLRIAGTPKPRRRATVDVVLWSVPATSETI